MARNDPTQTWRGPARKGETRSRTQPLRNNLTKENNQERK